MKREELAEGVNVRFPVAETIYTDMLGATDFKAGATGQITYIHRVDGEIECFCVTLDEWHPLLDGWENRIDINLPDHDAVLERLEVLP